MYIEVDEGLPEHPKSNRLCALLKNPLAWAYVIKLWRWCCKYAKDGDLSKFKDAEIEYGIGWAGESGVLAGALRTAGFIEAAGDVTRVHDWMSHQGRALQRMDAASERKRQWRLSRGVDADATQDGTRTPRGTAGVPNLTKPSLTKSKELAAAEPPPLALLSTEPPQQGATRQAVLEAIATGSEGRFKASKPTKGGTFKLDALRKRTDALDLAHRIGEWLAAGGDAWKGSVDGRNIGPDLDAWVAQAESWDGGPVAAKPQPPPAPTHQSFRVLPKLTRPA